MDAQPFKLQHPAPWQPRNINFIESPQVEGETLEEAAPCHPRFKSAAVLQYHQRGLASGWHGWGGRQRGEIGGVVTGAIFEVEIGARFNPALKLVIPSRPSKHRPSPYHQQNGGRSRLLGAGGDISGDDCWPNSYITTEQF